MQNKPLAGIPCRPSIAIAGTHHQLKSGAPLTDHDMPGCKSLVIRCNQVVPASNANLSGRHHSPGAVPRMTFAPHCNFPAGRLAPPRPRPVFRAGI